MSRALRVGIFAACCAPQEVKERLLAVGGFVSPGGPGQLVRSVNADIAKWGKAVRAAGVKAE